MIVCHIVEISEDDVMTYHFYYLSRATTVNSANTKLVTLTPGLRPEQRFAPLARGQNNYWIRLMYDNDKFNND